MNLNDFIRLMRLYYEGQLSGTDLENVLASFFDAPFRPHNEGQSNYAAKEIQPWDIWDDYPELTEYDKDILKRVLRTKDSAEDTRIMDYKKIQHICEKRICQIQSQENPLCLIPLPGNSQ